MIVCPWLLLCFFNEEQQAGHVLGLLLPAVVNGLYWLLRGVRAQHLAKCWFTEHFDSSNAFSGSLVAHTILFAMQFSHSLRIAHLSTQEKDLFFKHPNSSIFRSVDRLKLIATIIAARQNDGGADLDVYR